MQLIKFNTVNELNTAGANFISNILNRGDNKLLCAATGSSATGIYEKLAHQKKEIKIAGLRLIKLDEWAGLPMDNPGSCEYYLQQYLLKPLDIAPGNYISFHSEAANPVLECQRIAIALKATGPIDICVLGLGLNGHIAFNDPAAELQPGVHLAKLSAASMAHPMVRAVQNKPTHGYTLGMADLLQSKTILLVVQGKHKEEILRQLLKAKISTQLPASFLWLHKNAYCYYCED